LFPLHKRSGLEKSEKSPDQEREKTFFGQKFDVSETSVMISGKTGSKSEPCLFFIVFPSSILTSSRRESTTGKWNDTADKKGDILFQDNSSIPAKETPETRSFHSAKHTDKAPDNL
jgi:hypothetical protein